MGELAQIDKMGKTNKNIRDDRKDKTLKSINGGIQKNKGFSLSKERMKLIWHLLFHSKKDVSSRYSSGDSFSKCFDEATGLNLLNLDHQNGFWNPNSIGIEMAALSENMADLDFSTSFDQ